MPRLTHSRKKKKNLEQNLVFEIKGRNLDRQDLLFQNHFSLTYSIRASHTLK